MRTSRNRRGARLLGAILPGMCALALAAEEPGPSERSAAISRGRQIYLTGVPVNGAPLTASVGDPAMDVPASILKCSNCHGTDGRGKAEGGVTPPSIRWEELTKPSPNGPAGRRRSAYSGKLLVRAIALGIDASGNRLDPAMPRYRLTHEQAADLVVYLEVLGREADASVTSP
jgi:mono/diheme cytochrome c family protein